MKQGRYGQRHCGVQLHRGQDRAGALHPSAPAAACPGQHDEADRRAADGDKGSVIRRRLRCWCRPGAEKLLVADNLSDDVLLLDAATGRDRKAIRSGRERCGAVDVSRSRWRVSKDGSARVCRAVECVGDCRSWISTSGTVGRKLALLKPPSPVAPGTHPCAFALSPDGKTLYVALANRDAVAAVNVGGGQFAVKGYFDTRLPGQSYFGAEPVALAVNANGSRLYVANMAQRCRSGDRHAQADARRRRQPGHGGAGRICAHGVDADFDGLRSRRHRAASCTWRPTRARERGRTTFRSAQVEATRPISATTRMHLHRHAALWVAGDAGRGGDRERTCRSGRDGAGVEPHEGGAGEDSFAGGSARTASSTSSTSSRRTAPTIRSSAT